MTTTIAAVIPSIPPRKAQLARALTSVTKQTRLPDQILVSIDHRREGPSVLRNRMVWKAGTEWVAFLDDDDEWLPEHLEGLVDHAAETGADLVYPWFELWVHNKRDETRNPLAVLGEDPFQRPFDERSEESIRAFRNFIPVTVLVRREVFMQVGGFPKVNSPQWPHDQNEDMGCWINMLDAGAKFVHYPHRTWRWRWENNTSGRTDRW